MNKIRILVGDEPSTLGGVEAWLIFWPLSLLERTYRDSIQITYSRGQVLPYEFFQNDILFVTRPYEASHVYAIDQAKKHGMKVILNFDDNFIDVPPGHGHFHNLYDKGKNVAHCIALADAVWVTTPALHEAYSKYNPNCTIIPNAIRTELLPEKANGNTRTAMWRGASAHMEDLWTWRPEYERMLKRLDNFFWVGYIPTWAVKQDPTTNVKMIMWQETATWFEFLKSMNLCAIWKPLLPAAINDAKSNISWMEATIAGGVLVTNYAGRPGWEYALRELPRNTQAFADAWERSAEHIRQHYDLRAWNEVRFREILKLANG
jgi:hypothetical protein